MEKIKDLLIKLKNKFIKFCKWIWKECKDWKTVVIFAIVVVIMYSPVWGGYLCHALFHWKWCSVMATAYLAFWAGPFTPFFPMGIAITLGIRRIIDKIKGEDNAVCEETGIAKDKQMILETERLYLRKMMQDDFDSLCKILQDEEVMYAYEGTFSDAEVQEWLDRQIARYKKWHFGLWAVILKETDEMIGQCGLTMQPWKGKEVLEIGYLFQRKHWHKGYAAEAAKACKKYAFEVLNADEVCSIIRDTNIPSQNVAIKNGMTKTDKWIKHYRGVDMPHFRYVVNR